MIVPKCTDTGLTNVSLAGSEAHEMGWSEQISHGDRVTVVNRHGQRRTGRAVMKGPFGWVLNMGGAHGTPQVATEDTIVRVIKTKRKDWARI